MKTNAAAAMPTQKTQSAVVKERRLIEKTKSPCFGVNKVRVIPSNRRSDTTPKMMTSRPRKLAQTNFETACFVMAKCACATRELGAWRLKNHSKNSSFLGPV